MKTYVKLFVLALIAMLIAATLGRLRFEGFCIVFCMAAVGLTIGGITSWMAGD